MPKAKNFDIGLPMDEVAETAAPVQTAPPGMASQHMEDAPPGQGSAAPQQAGIAGGQQNYMPSNMQQGQAMTQQYAAQGQGTIPPAQFYQQPTMGSGYYMPNGQPIMPGDIQNGMLVMQNGQPMMQSGQAMMVNGQPMMQSGQVFYPGYTQGSPIQENGPKGQRGRKKSLRTIPRQNGKVVFLEVEADAALARISILERVDKQDIIRTALDEFLKLHYDGSDLDAKGSQLLTEYIKKTTQIT